MSDAQQIEQLYHKMYEAMIAKNEEELNRVHDDAFLLIHMTGMKQDKQSYIRAIMNGTLNYFSAETKGLDISIDGNQATLIGHSRVTAAVFGGGKHTWRLEFRFHLKKNEDGWKFTKAQASTY